MNRIFIFGFLMSILLSSCVHFDKSPISNKKMVSMKKEIFGKTRDGHEVYLYKLENKNGMVVKITNYGGTVTSILFPDKEGKVEDMVLGYKNFDGYLDASNPYFGSLVGRFANRIANGKFKLDGVEYKLATNNGPNHLHGGLKGFDKIIWDTKNLQDSVSTSLELSYLSKNGEENYPGNLMVKVTYTLTNNNELKIQYLAETDKATPINLTNHCYFNLAGNAKRNVLDHMVKINANSYTPVDKDLIPTGELKDVQGTEFDFREFKKIGKEIASTGLGYDHNFVVNFDHKGILKIAEVIEIESKRKLEVFSNQPGVQFYTSNHFNGNIMGKEDKPYNNHFAFCLETQHFPDSPNQPNFPNCILRPGEKYLQTTIYKFSIVE